jgi:hypothetical protein
MGPREKLLRDHLTTGHTEWIWPKPEFGDFVIEPHEVHDEFYMGWVRKKMSPEAYAELLANEEVIYEGQRYVIRPVIAFTGKIDPEEWRKAVEEEEAERKKRAN